MKIKKGKIIAIFMAATLCLSVFSACSSSQPKDNNTENTTKSASDHNSDGNTADKGANDNTDDTTLNNDSNSNTDNNSSEDQTGINIGTFTTQDLNGESYTEAIFKDYDLTMVNVFTTWCTPCVEEMPYLEELSASMKEQNVQVIGVPLDVLDETGNIDEEMLDRAKLLAEQTGVTYPLLLPDSSYMNGMLTGVEAVPYTFFVDKNGNILGDGYGGNDLEGWTAVVEDYLNMAKGN